MWLWPTSQACLQVQWSSGACRSSGAAGPVVLQVQWSKDPCATCRRGSELCMHTHRLRYHMFQEGVSCAFILTAYDYHTFQEGVSDVHAYTLLKITTCFRKGSVLRMVHTASYHMLQYPSDRTSVYAQSMYINTLYTHNIHTTHTVHTQYTHCTHTVHTLYTQYTHNVHTIYTQCTHNIHTIYTQYTHNVHTMYTQYTHNIHTIYTQYTHNVHTIYTQYTHNIHTMYTQYTRPRNTHSTKSSCSSGSMTCVCMCA
jgi:hypothetical protein